jgi:hypothetical protein
MSSTSDFVKKLYKYASASVSSGLEAHTELAKSFRMLEDPNFQHVVSWGPGGDCFVVKDMNEFTKSILPRMFKHSNFASFVRQLNKYDFHKVKNTDDNQFGDHVSLPFRTIRSPSSPPVPALRDPRCSSVIWPPSAAEWQFSQFALLNLPHLIHHTPPSRFSPSSSRFSISALNVYDLIR